MNEESSLNVIKKKNLLSIIITDFKEIYILKKREILFNIRITNNINNTFWNIEKNYEDFENLYKSLIIKFSLVPYYPKKILFKIINIDLIKKIKIEFENFLNDCIERKDILFSEELNLFLDINKNFPEIKFNEILEIGKIEKLTFEIKDFIYDKKNQIIIIITSQNKNEKLNNQKFLFTWEKKIEGNKLLGNIYCYKINKNSNKVDFNLLFSKEFFFRPKKIFFDNFSNFLFLGFYNGNIIIFKLEDNCSKITEIKNFNFFNKSINDFYYNSNLKKLFSISLNQFFYIDLNEEINNPIIIKENIFNYTSLTFESEKNNFILTNEKGFIEIYDDKNFNQIFFFKTTSGEKILNLQFSKDKKFIFICDSNGKISIINYENKREEIISFKEKDKINYIQIDNIRNLIYSCDNKGRIFLWDLIKKKSIYCFKYINLSIKKILYDEESNIIISGGKDKQISVFLIPEIFYNKEIEQFDINEEIKYNEVINNFNNKLEYDFNYENDLNGWNLKE